MKIVATALAKDEAEIIDESVRAFLAWGDAFVIYDNGSTDGTPDLAEKAGALVLRGPAGEPWNEGMRQHMLDALPDLYSTETLAEDVVVMRVDIDEIYHIGPGVEHPRAVIEKAFGAGAFCLRAVQAEFWITLDDMRRGAIFEDARIPVQKRRRWYTIGHTALVAWRWRPDLRYYSDVLLQKRRNVPILADGRDVAQIGMDAGARLLQKHYNCQSVPQLLRRIAARQQSDKKTFGKYWNNYNLIIDESIGLHYLGPDEVWDWRANHHVLGDWYRASAEMFADRGRAFGW